MESNRKKAILYAGLLINFYLLPVLIRDTGSGILVLLLLMPALTLVLSYVYGHSLWLFRDLRRWKPGDHGTLWSYGGRPWLLHLGIHQDGSHPPGLSRDRPRLLVLPCGPKAFPVGRHGRVF